MNHLFSPLQLGKVKLENRIVMPPMARELSTKDGKPTDELINHYRKVAQGIGLLIVEHAYVSHTGKLSKKQLGIHKDSLIEKLKLLTEAVHAHNVPVSIQLNHAGGVTYRQLIGEPPIAPSSPYFNESSPEEIPLDEIEAVQEKFADAAERAIKAGFDGVEIHGAHGFLLHQFVSPLTNYRADRYGRETLENRMRFPLEVVEKVKKRIDDALLLYRLGAKDYKANGLQIEESQTLAEKLEEKGVDMLDVTRGLSGVQLSEVEGKQGKYIPLAEKIKQAVDIPVIGEGELRDPQFADTVIRENRVDLVGVGKAMLENPRWAIEAKQLFQ